MALGIERLPAVTPPIDQTETAEETGPAQTAWIVRPGAAPDGELRNLYRNGTDAASTLQPTTTYRWAGVRTLYSVQTINQRTGSHADAPTPRMISPPNAEPSSPPADPNRGTVPQLVSKAEEADHSLCLSRR